MFQKQTDHQVSNLHDQATYKFQSFLKPDWLIQCCQLLPNLHLNLEFFTNIPKWYILKKWFVINWLIDKIWVFWKWSNPIRSETLSSLKWIIELGQADNALLLRLKTIKIRPASKAVIKIDLKLPEFRKLVFEKLASKIVNLSQKMTSENLSGLAMAFAVLALTFGFVSLFPQRFAAAQENDDSSDDYINWASIFGRRITPKPAITYVSC